MRKKDVKLELEWAERWNADRSKTLEDKMERGFDMVFEKIGAIAAYLNLDLEYTDEEIRYTKRKRGKK